MKFAFGLFHIGRKPLCYVVKKFLHYQFEVSLSDILFEVYGAVRFQFRTCLILAHHHTSGILFKYLSVVCDHDYGRAFVAVYACEQFHYAVCSLVVEISCGLICYYYRRIIQQ